MASIRQRGRKKIWYALFRDAKGSLIQRSTKLTEKRKAQDLADEWEKMARPSMQEMSVENMRRVIADLHRRFLGREMPTMTVKNYVADWLNSKHHEVGPDTMSFYSHSTSLFLKYLGKRAELDLFRICRADVVGFRDAERARVSAKTTNHSMKVLRMLFRQAHADGWTPENPTEGVKIVREVRSEKVEVQAYTEEQLAAVLAVADEEWRAMIIRAYYTGQRLLDIALMTGRNEDPHLGTVKFWSNKTDLRIIIEMAPPYIEWVLSQKTSDAPAAPLHPRAHASVMKRKKNRTVTISNQFARLLSKAGIREARKHRKAENGPGRNGRRKREPLNFHSLRHSMVTDMANAGISRSVVMDIVGHESEEINIGYTHHDRKTKQAAVEKLRDITRIPAAQSAA